MFDSDALAVHITTLQVDGTTGEKEWSYEATSDGVSEGRAFALHVGGDDTVVVAGTAAGGGANPTGKDTVSED